MSIRKLLLLAGMALVAVAVAAPVAAQANPKWFNAETEEFFAEEVHTELHAVGELTLTSGNLVVGPCSVTAIGLAENNNAMASGTITNVTGAKECPTNRAGCTATPTYEGLPWEVTGTTKITGSGSGVEIKGISLSTHFDGTCELPVTTIVTTGTATPINCVPECLTFDTHADDLTALGFVPADLGGTFTFTNPLAMK